MPRNRHKTLLWMKDLIDHMHQCHEQLQWAADNATESFLADSLLVDVSEFQRLCEQLKSSRKTGKLVGAA